MIARDAVFATGDQARIWQRFCGFFDLSLPEFIEIQESLMMEQIELVFDNPLIKKFMPRKPRDISEFRDTVPLTTYDDYYPYLSERDESILPVKPYRWSCTSGRGGASKWVPYTERAIEKFTIYSLAIVILACTTTKGEVNIHPGLRVLHNLPAPPYLPGVINELFAPQIGARLIPPSEKYSNADFEAKIRDGFQTALSSGADMLASMTSILVKMGERFTESSGQLRLNRSMLDARIMSRFIRAWLKCKREGRSMLPKDLWPLKGLACYGMDTSIYRDQVKFYWGIEPLEMYGATESGVIATQAWNKKAMTFVPASCFLEFAPEAEWLKSREDRTYQPSTVLLNEVEPGARYEIIISSLWDALPALPIGGPHPHCCFGGQGGRNKFTSDGVRKPC